MECRPGFTPTGTSHLWSHVLPFLPFAALQALEETGRVLRWAIAYWAAFRTLLLSEQRMADDSLPRTAPQGWKLYYIQFNKDFEGRVAEVFGVTACRLRWRIPWRRLYVPGAAPEARFPGLCSRVIEFGPAECCQRPSAKPAKPRQGPGPSPPLPPRLRLAQWLRSLRLGWAPRPGGNPNSPGLNPDTGSAGSPAEGEAESCACATGPRLGWRLLLFPAGPDGLKLWVQTTHSLQALIRVAAPGRRPRDPSVRRATLPHFFTPGPVGGHDEARFLLPGILPELRDHPHLHLQVDILLLPTQPRLVAASLPLLAAPRAPAAMRAAALLHLQHRLAAPLDTTKLHSVLQVSDQLPLLTSLLTSPPPNAPHFQTALLVLLSGLYDTPTILTPTAPLVALTTAVVDVLCTALGAVTGQEPLDIPFVHPGKSKETRRRALTGECEAFAARLTHAPAGPAPGLAAYALGALYNVVRVPAARKALLQHPAFLPAVLHTLSAPSLYHAHFAALHCLAALRHAGVLPRPYHSVLSAHLQGYLAYFPSVDCHEQFFSHLGVTLGERDLAAVYIPYLQSPASDCRHLALFVFHHLYFLRLT